MGRGGFEPPTSPLSGARSNQLSYRPEHSAPPNAGCRQAIALFAQMPRGTKEAIPHLLEQARGRSHHFRFRHRLRRRRCAELVAALRITQISSFTIRFAEVKWWSRHAKSTKEIWPNKNARLHQKSASEARWFLVEPSGIEPLTS